MKIIGINAYHADSSACLIIDGEIISAVEEERFTRIKHWAGFPIKSINYCLNNSGLKLSDIDFISVNRDNSANFSRKIIHLLSTFPNPKLILERIKNREQWSNLNTQNQIKKNFREDKFRGKYINVEHHLAHLSSCFYVSPFSSSCILSIDGFGDFASTVLGYGTNNNIKIDKKVFFPHSIGVFYEAMTRYLGFENYGDEYKVMGLAPYGKPIFFENLKKIVLIKKGGEFKLNLDYFLFHKSKQYEVKNNQIKTGQIYSKKLIELLGPNRLSGEEITQYHKDIASSTQKIYEEVFFNSLEYLHKKYKNENISISGGCGMNSVANGKILTNTNFKKIYIQPAAGDAGGALGSALHTYKIKSENPKKIFMKHAYWGNKYSNEYIEEVCKKNLKKLEEENCKLEFNIEIGDLISKVAKEISNGKVIGWFQGNMEWGPRALGNRSILADPRNSKMKNILNFKIKRRESFRPFAPSILREHVKDWFEIDDEVQFMMKVYQIKKDKRQLIPAVTHVDGSGRLQTVYKETNEKYFNLIQEFYKITNVPLILNTSFNENEPVVCQPEEALNCFLRTKMDLLVMENYLIQRI